MSCNVNRREIVVKRNITKKMSMMGLLVLLICSLGFISACSQNDANAAKSKYVDDKAMNVIAAGFERRSDVIESNANDDDPHSTENIQEAIEAEIKNDKELKNARFKDSKMQQGVITYLNLLDDQLKVTEDYSQSSSDYYEEWNKVYDKRSAQLKKLVDNYGLEVREKYEDDFNDLIKNGKSVAEKTRYEDAINSLIQGANFEKSDDGYGLYTYTAVVENTSGVSFSNVSLTLALYDADDIKAEETYADTSSWAPGEKVKFEAMSDVDAARVVASVSSYDVNK
jgi:hypothetical protein